jgi:hypothetical protein
MLEKYGLLMELIVLFHFLNFKSRVQARYHWFMPVILATQMAEMGGIIVQSQVG